MKPNASTIFFTKLNHITNYLILHQERRDTISKLMGDVLEDLTKASLDKIEKYVLPVVVAPKVAAAEEEAAPEPV